MILHSLIIYQYYDYLIITYILYHLILNNKTNQLILQCDPSYLLFLDLLIILAVFIVYILISHITISILFSITLYSFHLIIIVPLYSIHHQIHSQVLLEVLISLKLFNKHLLTYIQREVLQYLTPYYK